LRSLDKKVTNARIAQTKKKHNSITFRISEVALIQRCGVSLCNGLTAKRPQNDRKTAARHSRPNGGIALKKNRLGFSQDGII